MARNVEERAGNGNGVGNWDKQSSDVDNMTSGSSIDSKQVKVALLAAGSQYTCYRSRFQGNSSPVLSRPPTSCIECLYGPTRCKCRCRKLKIEHLNNKKSANATQEGETTYCGHASIVQPLETPLKCLHRVHRPSCQHT